MNERSPRTTKSSAPSCLTPAEELEMREDAREAVRLGRSIEWIAGRMGVSDDVVRSWVQS